MSELGTLLQELEDVSAASTRSPPVLDPRVDNRLVQVRLGIASSLFTALRLKHGATAGHSLRVALNSSAWALKMRLPDEQRDAIEVAALLHDVGMIGVPDQILSKPGSLDPDEQLIIERSRAGGVEILRSACAEPAILDIVEHVAAWYDGSKRDHHLAGDQIPIGARMIAIVEAFDAMTTDHVFRPAMSQERAATELFAFAGSQFDPQLVKEFVELHEFGQSRLLQDTAHRWLQTLNPEAVNSQWSLNVPSSCGARRNLEARFQVKLLDNMHDAVVFVDTSLRVVQWNHGAERLTGISGESVRQRQWQPSLLNMRNEKGDPIGQEDCPVSCAIESGVQSMRRLTIWGRNGRPISVDTHSIPVVAEEGVPLGAILLLHDASPETSLEERCQSLHEKATKDPLTQVANRAELDRVHEAFVSAHKQQQVPCSLIICDLDRFKQVNDTYGHQAGDEVIKNLAMVLKNACRPGDLVARYGGEEFVMLCADCDNASALRRAEHCRKTFGQIHQSKLEGRSVTASFGVTEIQPGDTPETMLRRSDRALLMAKAKGRNNVVQLGSGSNVDEADTPKGFWPRKAVRPALVLEQDLLTPVPIKVAVEKLRGFVADHRAKIVSIEGNHVKLEIDDRAGKMRRRSDRSMIFAIELRFEEEQFQKASSEDVGGSAVSRTRIHASVSPCKKRDRRRADVDDRAREVLASFRSYLMATAEAPPTTTKGVLRRASWILAPWLAKR